MPFPSPLARISDIGNGESFETLGASDLVRSAGLARQAQIDTKQIFEPWTDIAAWTFTGDDTLGVAVADGHAYSNGGDAISVAWSCEQNGRGYVATTWELPAGPDTDAGDLYSSMIGLGITSLAPGDAALTNDPENPGIIAWVLVDLFSGALVFVNRGVNGSVSAQGSGPTSITGGDQDAFWAVDLTDAQTLGVVIAWDETSIQSTIIGPGHLWEVWSTVPRGDDVITSLFTQIDDTRGITGGKESPISAKQALASLEDYPNFTGGPPIRKPASDLIVYTASTEAQGGHAMKSDLRLWIPKDYDSRVPAPLIIWCHGAFFDPATTGATAATTIVPDGTGDAPVFQALVDAGFIIASVAGGGDTLGNQEYIDDIVAAYRYCRDRLNIGPVIMMGESGGGMPSITTLYERRVPNVVGVILYSPLLAFTRMYNILYDEFVTQGLPNDLYFTGFGALPASFWQPLFCNVWGKTDFTDTSMPAAVAPYDPSQVPAGSLRGASLLFFAGDADDGIPGDVEDCQTFLAIHGPFARESNLIVIAGGIHGDPRMFQSPYVDQTVEFALRCVRA